MSSFTDAVVVVSRFGFNTAGALIAHFLASRNLAVSVTDALFRFRDARPPGVYSPPIVSALVAAHDDHAPSRRYVAQPPTWDPQPWVLQQNPSHHQASSARSSTTTAGRGAGPGSSSSSSGGGGGGGVSSSSNNNNKTKRRPRRLRSVAFMAPISRPIEDAAEIQRINRAISGHLGATWPPAQVSAVRGMPPAVGTVALETIASQYDTAHVPIDARTHMHAHASRLWWLWLWLWSWLWSWMWMWMWM